MKGNPAPVPIRTGSTHRQGQLAAALTGLLVLVAGCGDAPTDALDLPGATPHPMNTASHAAASSSGVIIDNGVVQLGVLPTGNLGVPGGTPSHGTASTTNVGARYMPTNADATAPGCICEGWGVADAITGVFGAANVASDGVRNMTVEDFTATESEAVSVVTVGSTFRVTHNYRPSPATSNLYEVVVTVENISDATVDLLYRRSIDWDIAPNTFNEFVTVQGTASENVLFANNNGFASANPLAPRGSGPSGDFENHGPADQGVLFDFGFGELAAGESRTFLTFYGATDNQAQANVALSAVGAEVFSFGQANYDGSGWDPAPGVGAPTGTAGFTEGVPHTFIFAFAAVGGDVIFQPPVADAGGPYTARAAESIDFDGSGSSSPDGRDLTFEWDFGDGETATGESPSHTYFSDGSFTVVLTVTDTEGFSAADTTTATITTGDDPVDPDPDPDTLAVDIRITPDTINLATKRDDGLLILSILSTSDFDAGDVVVASLTLGDGEGNELPISTGADGRTLSEMRDMNGDGLPDLVTGYCVCDLVDADLLNLDTTELVLMGALGDGTPIRGSAAVVVIDEAPAPGVSTNVMRVDDFWDMRFEVR